MLTRSGPSNTSGKSVTTLIVSIGLFHGHEVVAPRLHHRARSHPDERQQPLAMVGTPPRHAERSRHDVTLLVHDQQPRVGREHPSGVFHEGKHRHFPLLPVRLAYAPDLAGRMPSTPAFCSSGRTVSVGSAPLSSQARACSASAWMSAGLVRGL